MTREEKIKGLYNLKEYLVKNPIELEGHKSLPITLIDYAVEAIEQEPCGMTAEDYRQRMIQAFHNADCDGLIAVCVLPTEKEFERLEWWLKNHYKREAIKQYYENNN